MIDDATKRDIKRYLVAAGFDANVVDELIIERKTLRDEFAMAAITGVAALDGEYRLLVVAQDAYRVADEMLVVRKQSLEK